MFVQQAPPSKPRVACSKNEVSTPLSGADYFVIPDLIGNLLLCHTEAFWPSVSPWFVISSEGEAGVEKSILHFFQ